MADQLFWGRRVAALGVGPPPVLPMNQRMTRISKLWD